MIGGGHTVGFSVVRINRIETDFGLTRAVAGAARNGVGRLFGACLDSDRRLSTSSKWLISE